MLLGITGAEWIQIAIASVSLFTGGVAGGALVANARLRTDRRAEIFDLLRAETTTHFESTVGFGITTPEHDELSEAWSYVSLHGHEMTEAALRRAADDFDRKARAAADAALTHSAQLRHLAWPLTWYERRRVNRYIEECTKQLRVPIARSRLSQSEVWMIVQSRFSLDEPLAASDLGDKYFEVFTDLWALRSAESQLHRALASREGDDLELDTAKRAHGELGHLLGVLLRPPSPLRSWRSRAVWLAEVSRLLRRAHWP